MSDLSWLNPTPHAIAVYASRSLSPVATRHSLPSGRYPLLGPDFHRLDRTSLRLAHSFDHLIGECEQLEDCVSPWGQERLRAPQQRERRWSKGRLGKGVYGVKCSGRAVQLNRSRSPARRMLSDRSRANIA